MTEHYWQRYKKQLQSDPYNSDDVFWKNVRKDLERRNKPKHHLELYSYCKNDNVFIRQVKNSPNITLDTVSEMICRDKGCELQYCMSLQKEATSNSRSKINLQGCQEQYQTFYNCLQKEKMRIFQKEQDLFNKVMGIEPEKIENIQVENEIKQEKEKEKMAEMDI